MNFADRAHGKISRARFRFRSGVSAERRQNHFEFAALCRDAATLPRAKSASSRRRLQVAAGLLTSALCLLTSGCFRHEAPANVTIINGNEPESLDPHIVTGVSEMRLTKALFDGLTKLDPTNATPVPALAASWEISPDGRVYTFHLRTNAVWSTGEPITTEDVLWSWFRALSPATAGDYAGQLFYIKGAQDWYEGRLKDSDQVGIHALDARTLRVELNSPLAFFLELCSFPTLAIVPKQTIEKYGDRWLHARPLPTSGAFTLGAWRVNDKVRFLRNSRYWDAANTASEIIDVLPVGSPNTALNLYETGVADVVWDKDLVPTELMDVLIKRPDFHSFTYLGTYFYRFNVTKPPFNDPRVRRAFALATDKPRIINKLTKGAEIPATNFVPAGVANYTGAAGLPFDPDAARRELAAAGFPGGKGFPRVSYTFFSAAGGAKLHPKVGVELQQMWHDVLGVDVELRQIERKVFYSSQSRLDYDISTSSWIGDYNDANTFLDLFTSTSGNNRTGWKNARYDELVHRANNEVDSKKRAEIFCQAETILIAEEPPIVPLYFYAGFNYFDPNKIGGIWQNILDEHPMQFIYKKPVFKQ
ncbi:MAG: peptide ABC transporter substrate-binding protein [Verrucomicrobia bacterium]|nr:MAG: peptide ABC transporter substrate-binding protein [Verrucomicrobiota bacterium]